MSLSASLPARKAKESDSLLPASGWTLIVGGFAELRLQAPPSISNRLRLSIQDLGICLVEA